MDSIQDNRIDRVQDDRMQDRIDRIDRIQDDRIEQDRISNGVIDLVRNAAKAINNRTSASKEEEEAYNNYVHEELKGIDALVYEKFKLQLGILNRWNGKFYDLSSNELKDYHEAGSVYISVCVEGYRATFKYILVGSKKPKNENPLRLKIYKLCEVGYTFIHRVHKKPQKQEYLVFNKKDNLIIDERNDEHLTIKYINNFIETYLETG